MAERLNERLLELLVCPKTHAKLVHAGDWLYSTHPTDRRKYPIRDGIPIMLVEESVPVTDEEYQSAAPPQV